MLFEGQTRRVGGKGKKTVLAVAEKPESRAAAELDTRE